MKAGKYTIKELFSNRYVEQIIVPEIQRDYVWGEEQITGLINSIYDDFIKYSDNHSTVPKIETSDNELIKSFEEFYKKRNYSANIGFIYAYNDEQFPGKYYLIDGQQRITTIYLLLSVLGSLSSELKAKFKSNYLNNSQLKLDYKVRESAHQFLKNFIPYTLEGRADYTDDKSYYSNIYDNDKTIQSLLKNSKLIKDQIKKLNPNLNDFYFFIENLIYFWYFDTNISEQGEELYIFMNARGEQMQGNENIKADLLGKLNSLEQKNKYGRQWEEWQDFFWKHRGGTNENADKGFNQFLTCIAGLERYLNDTQKFYSKQEFDKTSSIRTSDIIEVLSIETIEKYFDAWNYLVNNIEKYKSIFSYHSWLDKAINEIWTVFNENKINWFANYEDDNRATERNNMVFIWSTLLFVLQKNTNTIQLEEVYRLLRIYYVRFNNNIRSVKSIKGVVKVEVEFGIWKETSLPDEKLKFTLFETCDRTIIKDLEMLIYEIEDHPFNLRGRDVGNINISHLVDFTKPITIQYLQKVRDKFNELFLDMSITKHKLKNVLLFYGTYYDEISPYYYLNLDFCNWYRIIRGIGDYIEEGVNPFKLFFNEFIEFNYSFDQFLIEKNKQKIEIKDVKTLREKLLWYSQRLEEEMWSQGEYIAVSKGNNCALPDWENQDETFSDSKKIYNTKGDLKGGYQQELFTLLK
jgi:uncharacterized protein with ParB-like and HNH nuclease domain